ncbi:hypothetical protein Dthio_PD3073 [Desulfonatronospira thiodismutans ASO3-1]|uniref:Uncharacterized protein n=1 Tax=Desulfonatronospira thiodismutans ASO3-1 TaxID=555779 RepID=D6SLT3_9BACT|nr:hypothetical protein [Desulfonatronospira thiodismutans]EFI35644.1 hypothetical protein Dthio_PD3073 [Desulfonatronospira thiodismutans ASO3-1]
MFFSRKQEGFSFLGFVVVLALIAFLLMIAIPQYLEYRDRDQDNTGLLDDPVKISQAWDKEISNNNLYVVLSSTHF